MIKKIYVEGLRCLNQFEYEFESGITVVHGPNGCGKTTILEIIHLLSQGFSFRARDLKELIGWSHDNFLARGNFEDLDFGVIERGLGISRSQSSVRENGVSLKTPSSFFGKIPAVVMQPSDIELLRGSPEVRRRWLDEILCYRSKANGNLLKHYRRVLQQRNQWLRLYKKEGFATGGEDLFEVLTEQLIELGAKLWSARITLSKEISGIITAYYRILSGGVDKITCSYKSSILKELDALDGAEFLDEPLEESSKAAESFAPYNVGFASCDESGAFPDGTVKEDVLQEAYRRKLSGLGIAERIQGITLCGPHKDDMGLYIGESELRSAGSQGQCRCASIAMRFAAVDVASRYLTKPILLLDDIFAELDVNRRNAVAGLIREKSGQVIIATPQLEELPFKADAEIPLA